MGVVFDAIDGALFNTSVGEYAHPGRLTQIVQGGAAGSTNSHDPFCTPLQFVIDTPAGGRRTLKRDPMAS
jgi:hypothetical protein